jgi:hypothetical protein
MAADEQAAGQPIVDQPNQGATANRPMGETPLTVDSDGDAFSQRPEAFVGAAFAGGFALALLVKRISR